MEKCKYDYDGNCNLRYEKCLEPETCQSYIKDEKEIIPKDKQEA
jgi:hypothetical protein